MTAASDQIGGPPAYPIDHRVPTVAGFALLVAAVGGFLLWAAWTPLSSAVVAPGTVVIDTYRKTVQHLEGGIIAAIEVREGEAVESGQVLLRLDDTQLLAMRDGLRTRLAAERARAARLLSEQVEADVIAYPPDLARHDPENPELAKVLAGQTRIFDTRRASLAGESEILGARAAQLEAQIEGSEKQAKALGAQLGLAREELDAVRHLEAEGYAPRTRRLRLERETEQIGAATASTLADIARAREALGETEMQIVQIRRRFQEGVAAELREAQAAAYDLGQQLRAVENRLERTAIVAPVAGRIVALKVHAVGGVVEPAQPLMDIVPAHEPLLIEAQVAPASINHVERDRRAELRFPAFRGRDVPMIQGKVTLISADSLLDPATRAHYYTVRVTVPREQLRGFGPIAGGEALIPGMPVEVVILTGERTFLDYLLDPLTDTLRLAFREE